MSRAALQNEMNSCLKIFSKFMCTKLSVHGGLSDGTKNINVNFCWQRTRFAALHMQFQHFAIRLPPEKTLRESSYL